MNSVVAPPTDKPYNPDKPFVPCGPSDMSLYEQAKVRFVFRQKIPVSPARLFESFEDPTSWPKWAHGIGKVVWTSPKPYAAGTTRTVIFWGGMEVYEDFLVFDAPKEMAFIFYGVSQDDVFERFGEHYSVEDHGDGTCTLTWTVAFDPKGGFAKVMWMVKPFMRLNLRSYMWRLARYCRKLPA
jgi:hypothetical protein